MGKTRVKKFQGDWCKEFEWLRQEGEGPMFCLTGSILHMCSQRTRCVPPKICLYPQILEARGMRTPNFKMEWTCC